VLKQELLFDPCIDIVGNALPNDFVDGSGEAKSRMLKTHVSVGAISRTNRSTRSHETRLKHRARSVEKSWIEHLSRHDRM